MKSSNECYCISKLSPYKHTYKPPLNGWNIANKAQNPIQSINKHSYDYKTTYQCKSACLEHSAKSLLHKSSNQLKNPFDLVCNHSYSSMPETTNICQKLKETWRPRNDNNRSNINCKTRKKPRDKDIYGYLYHKIFCHRPERSRIHSHNWILLPHWYMFDHTHLNLRRTRQNLRDNVQGWIMIYQLNKHK